MASVGPNTAGTAASVRGSGDFEWYPTEYSTANDDTYVEGNNFGSGIRYSEYLKLTNFGFAVPAGATINGVVVHIHRKFYAPAGGGCYDNTVSLVKGGSITGDNKSKVDMWSNSTEQDITYGAVDNTWGTSLTVDDVNASTFGLALQVYLISAVVRGISAQVDYVTMTVYYTAGAAPASQTRTPVAIQPLLQF
jgi:hypothetical protein